MVSSTVLGNLIRLVPLQLSELPIHPAFTVLGSNPRTSNASAHSGDAEGNVAASKDSRSLLSHPRQPSSSGMLFSGNTLPDEAVLDPDARPGLIAFLTEVLDQAISFVDDIVPKTFVEKSEKTSSPAVAKVKVLKREIDSQQLSQIPWENTKVPRIAPSSLGFNGEAWFARRSQHANQAQKGTASFSEFEHGLMVDHSEHEQEYTPDVYDARPVLDWDTETASTNLIIGESYSQIRMCSRHSLAIGATSIY